MVRHAAFLIDGEWIEKGGDGSEPIVCLDPATGEPAGTYASAAKSDVAEAIRAARAAFEESTWAHSPRLRAQVLLDFAHRLTERRDEIEEALVCVNGKMPREAMFEVASAISKISYYAGLARNIFGRITETEPGRFSNLAREPIGVVGIIVPWNAPVTLLISSLAPALAAGCCVVIKSAPQTSLVSAMTVACLSQVPGLPKGVVNLFTEQGFDGSQQLVQSTEVDMISFTGSSSVGKRIMVDAARTLKRVTLELGGKSPSILLPDADLDAAVTTLTAASMVMAGQMCTAASRVLVHESIASETRAAFTAALSRIKVGPGSYPDSQMGPLIDHASRDRVASIVERAGDEGQLHLKGKRPDTYPNGAFLSPTLVEVENVSSSLIQEEVFGPVMVLETFADEQEAVFRANATRFGLSASVWTADRNRGERIARGLQAGAVWINSYNRLLAEAENGGYRESGIGRLNGLEGLDEFLQTKHIYYEIAADV